MRLETKSDIVTPHIAHGEAQEAVLESEPTDLEGCLNQGIAAARSGDRETARRLLSSVTAADPRSADAWLWLASISENPEELLGFLENVLEIDPENERARQWKTATCSILSKTFVQRGVALSAEGQLDFAEECFNTAISHEPLCESAWLGKAKLGRDEAERVECLERVLRINPKNSDARKALDEILEGRSDTMFFAAQKAAVKGNRKIAEKLVDELLESDTSHLGAWTLRSLVSIPLDEKLLAFDRILEIDPKNSYARSGHDFLVRVFDAARHETAELESAEEVSLPEVSEVNTDRRALEAREELEVLPEGLDLTDEPQDDDKSQEVLARTEDFVDPLPELEFEHETLAEQEPLEIADEPLSAEFGDEPIHDVAANSDVGDDQLVVVSEPVQNVGSQDSRTDHDTTTNESPTIHFESAFTGKPTDERIHEFLTEDSFTLPAHYRSDAEEKSPGTDETHEHPESRNMTDAFEEHSAVEETNSRNSNLDRTQATFAAEEGDVDTDNFAPESVEDVKPAIASFDPVETGVEDAGGVLTNAVDEGESEAVTVASGYSCPFCAGDNDPQAFSCRSCHAVLSISDLDSLLADSQCDREAVLQAVTEMEAEWNLREFNENELTTLGIGQFNLNNPERGLAYLQEASRLNPNNVILAGQVNALVIRLDEMRRQTENHESMPKGKTILVVDDSPTVRKLISSKLEKSGHKVLTAVDGVDALEVMENVVPDLVLLDIAMPRMDGYSVCKLIRANEAVKKVPVVMISGKDGFFDKVRGRMAGTTGYITKPFGPETLMRALETYLVSTETEAPAYISIDIDTDADTDTDTE